MRKTKVKEIKKYAVLSLAVLLLGAGAAFSATDWQGVQDEITGASGDSVDINIENDMYTNNTPLNLGAPPVPSSNINITGTIQQDGNNPTITAGDGGTSSSYIINNGANTTITNVNFANGHTTNANGGAIVNSSQITVQSTNPAQKVVISGNMAEGANGGAISNSGTATFDNVLFSGNSATGDGNGLGGAIYNRSDAGGTSLTVTNSIFEQNTANAFGGAIINLNGSVVIDSTQFNNNSTTSSSGIVGQGGAIVNAANMEISNSSFTGNHTGNYGGAISNTLQATSDSMHDMLLNITNTTFDGNYSGSGGGAINNAGGSHNVGSGTDAIFSNTINIYEGTKFTNNYVTGSGTGGAIRNSSGNIAGTDPNGIVNIYGKEGNEVVFQNNIAASGGAIANQGTMNIDNAVFDQNGGSREVSTGNTVTTTNGGAIYNNSDSTAGAKEAVVTVSNSTFTNNQANSGGAVYNNSGTVNIIDSDFSGNKAQNSTLGGAVYGAANSNTVLRAQNRDMNVGNEQSLADVNNVTDTITLATDAVGNLQASAGRNLNIYSHINGNNHSVLNVNNDYVVKKEDGTDDQTLTSEGNVVIKNGAKVSNTNITVHNGVMHFENDEGLNNNQNIVTLNGGTLSTLNGVVTDFHFDGLNISKDSSLLLDVDLGGETNGGTPTMDTLLKDNIGNVDITNDAKLIIAGMKSLSEAKEETVKILFTDAEKLIGNVNLGNGANIVEAPINKYQVTQITQPVGGPAPADGTDPGEYFQFTKVGNSDSIIAGPVAAQAAFLIMDNLYRQSFANMDMVTLMSPEQRMAWKMRNKYANAGYHTGVYAPNVIPEERDGWYMRPFTNFENVPLKNGPRVSNVSYGSLFGGESDLIDLGHGWDGNFSFFGAYHGSHQAYNGVSIYQNGGTIGGVATAYKGNFWTGITANVGASAARATHMFGSDDFPILMTGAAWKSGYNWGLFNNKLVIQPSYMMSYTFVNVFDYTNSAGVKVTQDPLNAIEIIPGLRIIGNLKNGWQPYLGVNMTWNIMDKTKFYANEVALTQLSVKPYIEYGAGIQKRYGDRFTGFGQAMLRNGGRNGIAFTLGFRWALGN